MSSHCNVGVHIRSLSTLSGHHFLRFCLVNLLEGRRKGLYEDGVMASYDLDAPRG